MTGKTSAKYSSFQARWGNQRNHWLTSASKTFSKSWLKPRTTGYSSHCAADETGPAPQPRPRLYSLAVLGAARWRREELQEQPAAVTSVERAPPEEECIAVVAACQGKSASPSTPCCPRGSSPQTSVTRRSDARTVCGSSDPGDNDGAGGGAVGRCPARCRSVGAWMGVSRSGRPVATQRRGLVLQALRAAVRDTV